MFGASNMLKKCPFCGSTANLWLSENRLNIYVECDNIDCMARTGSGIDIMEVIAKWNNRAQEVEKKNVEKDDNDIGRGVFFMNKEKLPTLRAENLSRHSELKDTIELMTSNDYKERFIAEYYQLLIRYDKLGDLIGLYYEYKLLRQEPPMLDSPIELLNMQYEAMEKLLDILVIRAKIENIEL